VTPCGRVRSAAMEASRTLPARLSASLRSTDWVSILVLVLGAIGGLVLIAAELSPVITIEVLTTGTCQEIADAQVRDACKLDGLEQHAGAFLLLGALALVMAVGAALGRSRPAALALVVVAVAVVALVLLRDVPKADETGLVGIRYEQAKAGLDTGFYLSLVGAALCAGAGLLRLARPEPK
jgi:hypothetical protein